MALYALKEGLEPSGPEWDAAVRHLRKVVKEHNAPEQEPRRHQASEEAGCIFRGYRPLGGKLCSVTFRRKAGKWHVSAAWDRQALDPPKIEAAPIGIDRGVAVFAATSVGQLIDPLNAFDAIRDKLAKLQRRSACGRV
jgi:hypothetical protein